LEPLPSDFRNYENKKKLSVSFCETVSAGFANRSLGSRLRLHTAINHTLKKLSKMFAEKIPAAWLPSKVAKLGEFSPAGRWFSLAS
jgi:hypothetical protein